MTAPLVSVLRPAHVAIGTSSRCALRTPSSRVARLLTAGCLIAAVSSVAVPPADAAPLGAPFASVNVNCPSGSAQAAPLTSDHPNVVTRIVTTARDQWWTNASTSGMEDTFAGEQRFGGGGSLARNDSPTGHLWCSLAGAAQISFYDVPTAPTSYPQSIQDPRSTYDESLPFVVPSAARFVADVQLAQGAISIGGTQLASSSTVALGQLDAGVGSVSVDALDGPPARYTVAIRPLPVAISALKAPAAMRAGAAATLSYDTDGTTTATATITDAAGSVRKTLASYVVASGPHSLTFDGHGDDGQLLPDGAYTITVASNDPYGTSTQQTSPVRIDGTPPQITVTPPATVTSPIQISASDTSGVASLSADTPARFYEASSSYLSSAPETKTTTVEPPSSGWTAGSTVQIDVSAQDALGNKAARSTRAVLIPGGKPALATPSPPPSPLAGSPARQKRMTVARRGLLVSGTGTGTVQVHVRVSRALAKRLGSRSTTLAVRRVTTSGGRFRTLVRFSAKVRRAIRRRPRTTMTISVTGGATATKTIAIVK